MIYTKDDIHAFTCIEGIRWIHCPIGSLIADSNRDAMIKRVRFTDHGSEEFTDGDSIYGGMSVPFEEDYGTGRYRYALVQLDYCELQSRQVHIYGWEAAKVLVDKLGTLNHDQVTGCDGNRVHSIRFNEEGSIVFIGSGGLKSTSIRARTFYIRVFSYPQDADNPMDTTQCNHGCEACYTVCDKNRLIIAIENHFGVDLGSETESNKPVDLAINILKHHKPKGTK